MVGKNKPMSKSFCASNGASFGSKRGDPLNLDNLAGAGRKFCTGFTRCLFFSGWCPPLPPRDSSTGLGVCLALWGCAGWDTHPIEYNSIFSKRGINCPTQFQRWNLDPMLFNCPFRPHDGCRTVFLRQNSLLILLTVERRVHFCFEYSSIL
jgi:hypothetical protein